MFEKAPKAPPQILVPLETLAGLDMDLPIWMRHALSMERKDMRAFGRIKTTSGELQKELSYVVKDAQDKPFAQFSMGASSNFVDARNDTLRAVYAPGHAEYGEDATNRFFRGTPASMSLQYFSEYAENQPVPSGHILVRDVQFSKKLVSVIQNHFGTDEDINDKSLAEKFLFFTIIGTLSRSPEVAPVQIRNTFDAKNLMAVFEKCVAALTDTGAKTGQPIEGFFFGKHGEDNRHSLYYHAETGYQVREAIYTMAAQAIAGFTHPEIEAKQRLQLPPPSKFTP